jgi:hypothetical protein
VLGRPCPQHGLNSAGRCSPNTPLPQGEREKRNTRRLLLHGSKSAGHDSPHPFRAVGYQAAAQFYLLVSDRKMKE